MVQKDSFSGMCKAGISGETVDFPQLPFLQVVVFPVVAHMQIPMS